MLANATIGLAFFDRDIRFLRINRCLAEINGIPADAHLGRPLREVLPEFAETVEPIVHQIVGTDQPETGLEIDPIAWYYDEKDELPLYILKKAWDEGIMNLTVPQKYGGQGRGLLECALVVEEISAACAGIATSIFDNSLGTEPLLLTRNSKAKEKYLPVLVKDFKLICFATSEPLAGSDVAGLRCKAEKSGDDYILNGTKYWVTNSGVADYYAIFATIDPSLGHKGIAAFLVEKGWAGVKVGETIPKMGQRGSNTAGIHFTNCRVPAENVLAQPGEGFIMAMTAFSRTRPIIGSFGVGAAPIGHGNGRGLREKTKSVRRETGRFPGHRFQDRRDVPEGGNGKAADMEGRLGE